MKLSGLLRVAVVKDKLQGSPSEDTKSDDNSDLQQEQDKIQNQLEDLTKTIDQLRRRQKALIGPEVDPNTADAIRNSIQRRIDAIEEDKRELQQQLEDLKLESCPRSQTGGL